MAFKLSNGKYNVQIKYDEHIKKLTETFNYTDKKTSEIKTVKIVGIKVKVKGERDCYIKIPEWYVKRASWEKEIEGSNPTMILTLDEKAKYDVFTKIQKEERKIMELDGFQTIGYYDNLERQRKVYKDNEQMLNKNKVYLVKKENI